MRLMPGLALGYALLIVYASLYPLSGWRDSGVPLFDFLSGGWPRYFTGFDLFINVLGYVPLGMLSYAALQSRPAAMSVRVTWFIACVFGLLLATSLETLQNFLPSRIPSNIDVSCNALGALLGASLARWLQPRLLDVGYLGHSRQRLFTPQADAGLVLLALWLLTQLEPNTLLFGTGDVRRLIELPAAQAFSASGFRAIETTVVGTATLAVGLLAAQLPRQPRFSFLALTLAMGLLVKTVSLALITQPSLALAWATEGSVIGLSIGIALLWLARRLVPTAQSALAAVSLLIATVMVNLAPDNPYLDQMQQVWNPGQFLNFHGLTQFAASLWPFLALPWLMMYRKGDAND
ncbi:MAG: VanZ family protein [Rhodocyclaceae bacterium]|nr:VanZ family protein [Rhodocyclaceae bacterium]MBL0075255.1 VanZ family protein [Rhodocyclaceae bacterium]MBP6108981.1 VanZ family protein [Rhodocyclaceae bacterium]MBP6279935.1 VanZ family protein [Rhodocyclaceae bacterium]